MFTSRQGRLLEARPKKGGTAEIQAQRDAPLQPVWVELNPKGRACASLWSPSGLCVSNPDAFLSS